MNCVLLAEPTANYFNNEAANYSCFPIPRKRIGCNYDRYETHLLYKQGKQTLFIYYVLLYRPKGEHFHWHRIFFFLLSFELHFVQPPYRNMKDFVCVS